MLCNFEDQASGLRRLFNSQPASAIELITAGKYPDQLVLHALERLSRNGRRIVFLDEQSRGGHSYGDLRDCIFGNRPLEEVAGEPMPGVTAVGVAGIAHSWLYLDSAQRQALRDRLAELERRAALIAIHSAPEESHARIFNRHVQHRFIVAETSRAGVEGACAELVFNLPNQTVHICVASAKNTDEANAFFQGLQQIALKRWRKTLIWAGELERDGLEAAFQLSTSPAVSSFSSTLMSSASTLRPGAL